MVELLIMILDEVDVEILASAKPRPDPKRKLHLSIFSTTELVKYCPTLDIRFCPSLSTHRIVTHIYLSQLSDCRQYDVVHPYRDLCRLCAAQGEGQEAVEAG